MRTLAGLFLVLVILFGTVQLKAQDDSSIDGIINGLSLEHKVGQMFMVNLFGSQMTLAGQEILEIWQPGAVVLMESNIQTPEQITRLTNSYQETITNAGGLPLLVAVDQEGGIIARLQDGFTVWPVPMLLTAADDTNLAREVGAAMALELRAVGINMNLAPVADLLTNPRNPIIGRRSFGSVPSQVGRTIAGVIEGMQEGSVLATLKHFPGHGDTSEDSHVTLPVVTHDMERLRDVELVPFVTGIEAGSGTVMVAHIWFTELDPVEAIPASLSHNVVAGLLREELAYDGIIMTDALDMDSIDTRLSFEEAAVHAVEAGVDLIAIGANAGEGIQARSMQAVVDAVRVGRISEERIDESVKRILTAKQQVGVLGWQPLDPDSARERIDLEDHAALVQRMFEHGVTIAHDYESLLPLSANDRVTIIYPAYRQQIRRECGQYSGNVQWLAITDSPGETEMDTALRLVSITDKVVAFTIDVDEKLAVAALIRQLPMEQTAVVALKSPYDIWQFPEISTYVLTYSPLDDAVPVTCSVLFGEIHAGGTLPITLANAN